MTNDQHYYEKDWCNQEEADRATQRQVTAPPDARLGRLEPVATLPGELEIWLRKSDGQGETEQDQNGFRGSSHVWMCLTPCWAAR